MIKNENDEINVLAKTNEDKQVTLSDFICLGRFRTGCIK